MVLIVLAKVLNSITLAFMLLKPCKSAVTKLFTNSNPETVSTDFYISDKLYMEPLTDEDVIDILNQENPYGVLIQFGGQSPLKLAKK